MSHDPHRVLLELYLLVLFAYCILSLVIAYARISYDSPVIKVQRVLTSLVDPVLRPDPPGDPGGPGR